MEVILQVMAASAAAFLFYIFYNFSFFHPREYRLQTISFLFGISAVGLAMIIQTGLIYLFPGEGVFNRAFIYAAIPEEFAKLVFLFYLIKIHHHIEGFEISVAEGIFYGIIMGMSFGILENLFYGMQAGIWSLVLRSITSLPLHLLTSAIVAYFLMVYDFANKKNLAWIGIIRGFLIAVFFHGVYDYSVFSSSAYLIVVPVLLVVMFIITEYLIARSKSFLPASVLSMIDLQLDDYECIRNHRHFREWLDREQDSGQEKHIPIFRKMSLPSLIAFFSFSSAGITMALFYLLSPENIGVYFRGIGFGEYVNIFIFYPLFISFVYLTGGILNPDFISNRITGIPLIGIALIKSGDYSENSIIYAIDRKIFFAILQKPEMLRGSLNVSFWISGKDLDSYPAKILWINQSGEDTSEAGALIMLEKYSLKLGLYWLWFILKHIMKNVIIVMKKRTISPLIR